MPKQELIAQISSPLSGIDERSLDALMASDVELMSDRDFDRIVLEVRRQRAVLAKNKAEAESAKGARKPRAAKGTVSLDLKDLGLE